MSIPSEEGRAAVLLGTKAHVFIDSFIAISEPGKFQAPRLPPLLRSPSFPVLQFPWQQAPDAEAGEGSWGRELLRPHQPGHLRGEETLKGADISPTVNAHLKKCFMEAKHTCDKIYPFHRFLGMRFCGTECVHTAVHHPQTEAVPIIPQLPLCPCPHSHQPASVAPNSTALGCGE